MLSREPLPVRSNLRCGVAAFALVLVSACGGGGGGSGGGGSSGSTGFIPVAGAPGGVLYARGTDVRPVRPGAKWVYHSHDFDFGARDYSVTAVGGSSANEVVETTSDDPTSPTTVTVDADGSVRVTASNSLDGSALFSISGFELRSPVRVNDQYVLYDGNLSNLDADGDGRADLVKLAFWRVVVGNEPIDLPNRPAAIAALRVDSFVAIEITPSGGGVAVRVDASTSVWYEPGVGVVRQTVSSSSPGRSFDIEDVLTGWDGVTEGRGYITQPQQYVGTQLTPVRNAYSAVGLADGALVLTGSGLHRLDRNGVVQATLSGPPIVSGVRLFRSSAGVRSLSGSWPAMDLHAFDNQGQYIAPSGSFNFSNGRPDTLSDADPAFASHPGSPWLWVAWTRNFTIAPGQAASEIVLRAVASDGSSSLPEFAFPVGVFVHSMRISATAGAAVLTWNEQDTSALTTVRTIGVSNAGIVAFNTSPVVVPAQFPGTTSSIVPVADATSTWLAWMIGRPTSNPSVLSPEPHGVMLDPLGNAIGNPSAAALPAAVVEPAFIDWPAGVVADSGHLFATGSAFGLTFPHDTQATIQMTYADYLAGAGPLASSIMRSASYRIPAVSKEPFLDPIVFSDRVLILSQSGNYYLRPTVIWR